MSERKKIFIADDDTDILTIIGLMLKVHGYDVISTTNANHIFDQKENLPDLILLDIWMSGIDGRVICKKLKENVLFKNIPVVFISANTGITEITAECKAQGFISKPFEMEHLVSKISTLLDPR